MYSKALKACLILAMACLTLTPSCRKDTAQPPAVPLTEQEILDKVLKLPATPYNYANIHLPHYISSLGMDMIDNTPADNPITDAGATLGRVLFYDKLLSANNTTACASCHRQANSFSDPAPFSKGFSNVHTTRNSMTLVNSRYYETGRFLWDERANTLEEQVLLPIEDAIEMGMTPYEMERRLGKEDHYKILFKRAFGDTVITRRKVALALAQFVRSLVSVQSRFDEGKAGPETNLGEFVRFTEQENKGMRLYQNHCGHCHGTPVHIASAPRNNGLDLVYADNGVGDITHNPADNGKFKTPSLRNVAVTAPYMHDGRFADLMEVIDFYSEGVQNHPNLDPSMREVGPGGQPIRLNFTQAQKEDLLVFLKTFTDEQFLRDVKYSDPFR